ncbi:MAG: glycosyltransferase family 39 protein [Geminocystis sp.]|nr:glycosyltransferase family 39 protein [Geminocystis sp.]MCS7146997.1 glycosyltransferase family 39 protein [Geminocystis sp.]MCX8077309.1 glycosyltransferase family 39 protein [Geminocystis sp.]MDW8115821.1 glycosyltransferase family 39 protein [Geminocystis sp.]MDW8463363.1 glycosyltransferase family 39 protein [Geminocystis sp.]
MYWITLWQWQRLFNLSILSTRLLSVIFSILSILAIYLVSQYLFADKLVAVITTTIFAFSPLQIPYSQEAREYSLWNLLSLLTIFYLFRAIRQEALG